MIKISDTAIAIEVPAPAPQVYTLDQINQKITMLTDNIARVQAELDKWTQMVADAKSLGVKTRAEVAMDAQAKVGA